MDWLIEHLDIVILGNTLRQLLFAVVMGGGILTLFYVWRNIAGSRFARQAKKTATELDDLGAEIIASTRPWFFVFFALYFSATFLNLPEMVHRVFARGATLVVILQLALWANRGVIVLLNRSLKKRLASDSSAATTIGLVSFCLRGAVWSIIFLLLLENLGFDVTAMVAGLGIGGIAIALALQNVLGDLFASLAITLDKPFMIGDFIIVGELMGTVEHIGIKTTRVRSLSGEQLVFSNADLLGSRIRNFKRMSERRVAFKFGVTYQTPADKLEQIPAIVREIIGAIAQTRFDRSHFLSFGDSSLDFETVYFVQDPDYNLYTDIQQAVNLALYRRFATVGIEFAYPTRTLFMHKE